MLELRCAGFHLPDRPEQWLLAPASAYFEAGSFWGLVGPNGSGKSTMLRLLSGEWKPSLGDVLLDGRSIEEFSARALARRRAVLTQKSALRFPFSVEEVVAFGAHHLGQAHEAPERPMTSIDAMCATHVETFSERVYTTLSGGEACRVDMARVLAQQTPILLLDEPTNHLDPRFQLSVLSLCRALADAGALVIAALHELNLAARHCDQLLMLKGGQIKASGVPRDVLHRERLLDVYEIPFDVVYDGKQQPFVMPSYSQYRR